MVAGPARGDLVVKLVTIPGSTCADRAGTAGRAGALACPPRPLPVALIPGRGSPRTVSPERRRPQPWQAAGLNHLETRCEPDRRLLPHRIIVGSESRPTRIDSLRRLGAGHPHLIGDFPWAGWDHLGEAGLGRIGFTGEDGFHPHRLTAAPSQSSARPARVASPSTSPLRSANPSP
ncbi:hypothetical protein ABZ656_44755 [Streptomyces sp. NPDC007095]|uniref:hypothetical protein n=1 Tax=Streptomyces sp. NPDC007095 TaxID=3154482 RepID=UPI0033EDEC7E